MGREFRILRRIRHPNISCVVGHFQTGSSWVQISDWFDGKTLEDAMALVTDLPLIQRIGLFKSIVAGLQFCHEKGVFHRNLDGRAVLVADDLQLQGQRSAIDNIDNSKLRRDIIGALVFMHDPKALPVISVFVEDAYAIVQDKAREALEKLH